MTTILYKGTLIQEELLRNGLRIVQSSWKWYIRAERAVRDAVFGFVEFSFSFCFESFRKGA